MPRGNRTGPMGAGPMTGRAAGYCAGQDVPGYANPGFGNGQRLGFRGGGRGWRHVYNTTGMPRWARTDYRYMPPAPAPESELAALQAQVRQLGDDLDALNKRIAEIAG
jgi:hypothetical protein